MSDATTRQGTAGRAVSVQGVHVSYGENHVLKDVNLEIEPGELFAFLGPSGCGKTTLLRLIAGFNQASAGRVLIGGDDVSALPPWKRDVGMVFQSYALWPHMTVARNVAFGLEERRVSRAEIDKRVAAALDMVGLATLGHRRPSELSGGQQQRVALARTIVIEPKVLLLDEPLSNLDARLRVEVRREIRQLQQRLGITTIFVTHDQEEANTICDRIAVMNAGQIAQVGTPMELYERPANLFVAGFLGSANIIEGLILSRDSGLAFDAPGVVSVGLPQQTATGGAAPSPGAASMVFRPQSVMLTQAAHPVPAGHIGLPGRVTHSEFLGATIRYGIAIGTGETAREILADVGFRAGEPLHPIGAAVTVGVAAGALQWLKK